METKKYIVAVDLGDSNVVIAVGSPSEGERINIEHIISRPSEGVGAGQIMNIDLAVKTLKGAFDDLRKTTGIEAKEVYAGISGEFIYCTSHTDHVFVPDPKCGVTQRDVEALFERMSNVMVSEDRVIMERIPQKYVINDTTEVENPVGVFGSPLSSTFNFISSNNVPISRLDMALRRLNITPRKVFSNSVVVGDAILSSDEKEEGVVVVDLGGGLTDISIYHRNVLRYISTIPIGAKAFNNDIRTLTIPERYIEALKISYGCALSSRAPEDLNVLIKGRTKHNQHEIAVYNLAAVIEARARDIAELINKEIHDSGYTDRIPYGIVLTGGSAQLRAIDELLREVTGLDVRVAEPEDVISPQTRTRITSSADSTVVGLLLHGAKCGPCEVIVGEPTVVAPPQRAIPHEPKPKEQEPVMPPATTKPIPAPQSVQPLGRELPIKPTAAATPESQRPAVNASDEQSAPVSINAAVAAARAAAAKEQAAAATTPTPAQSPIEEFDEQEWEQEQSKAKENQKPKKNRLHKWLDSFNTVVNKVNDTFDTGDDDEV